MKIPLSYYQNQDVVELAKNLLGKVLYTNVGGKISSGIITETEAYAGISDKASHAYGGKFTKRTQVLYKEGGYSYVYLCYGIHSLFNIVTGRANLPYAVLVRGIYPHSGKKLMIDRLGRSDLNYKHTDGPGKLTKALGITRLMNEKTLNGNLIWLEENGTYFGDKEIIVGPRIGIDYAEEDALLPYRFRYRF